MASPEEELEHEQRQRIADALTSLRACDVVLGAVTIALALVGTYLAFIGSTQAWVAAALWSFPVLNLVWSHITRRQRRTTVDFFRTAVFVPVAATIYGGAAGPLAQLWLPALVMTIGAGLVLGIATQSGWFGYLNTLAYCLALPIGTVVAGAPWSVRTLAHVLAIGAAGFIISLVGSKLGRSLADARARHREAEASRRDVESAMSRLAEAQLLLVQSARAAGMAEIATSVLHDVGNVLNSVSVAAELAASALDASRLSSLQRGVELLRSQRDDLPSFVATQKGRRVPELLAAATATVADSIARATTELVAQRGHIDHIRVVIAGQLTHARKTTGTETFELAGVVETAVHVGGCGRAHAVIQVVQRIDDLPPLSTDRHKLLQILINLVSNAHNAIHDGGGRTGTLEIVATLVASDRLRIEVRDDGIGIDAEAMPQLFRHGFTRRAGGHGFGLHSSANAAKELGGSLCAQSRGPGHGATFVLEIPTQLGADTRVAA